MLSMYSHFRLSVHTCQSACKTFVKTRLNGHGVLKCVYVSMSVKNYERPKKKSFGNVYVDGCIVGNYRCCFDAAIHSDSNNPKHWPAQLPKRSSTEVALYGLHFLVRSVWHHRLRPAVLSQGMRPQHCRKRFSSVWRSRLCNCMCGRKA